MNRFRDWSRIIICSRKHMYGAAHHLPGCRLGQTKEVGPDPDYLMWQLQNRRRITSVPNNFMNEITCSVPTILVCIMNCVTQCMLASYDDSLYVTFE